jgi:hypothetical protein
MQPIREIVIREWLPGSYTVIEDGRETNCQSRAQLRLHLSRELDMVGDPSDTEKIEELEQVVDSLRDDLQEERGLRV